MSTEEKTLLTVNQAAEHLKVSTDTILKMIHSGALKAINLRAKNKRPMFRIKQSDLDKVGENAPKRKLLTVQELAAYLNVTPNTVYRQIASGKLKFINVGSNKQVAYRFDPDDLWDERSGNTRSKK